MLHPIFKTLVSRPDLLVDHVAAYAGLAAQEISATGQDFKARIVSLVLAALFGVIFVLLAGVSIMVGVLHGQFHWALAAVPGAALVVALAALLAGRRPSAQQRFALLRDQFATDMALIRDAGEAPHGPN
jgi:Kef-type K+ transport system membrane component KefB